MVVCEAVCGFRQDWRSHNALERIALVLLALLPLSMFLGPLPTDIALSSIGLLFLAKSHRDQHWSWLRQSWLQWFGMLWLLLMLRSLFTDFPQESFVKSLIFSRYLLFSASLQVWLMGKPTARKFLFWGMAVAASLAMMDTLIQYVWGHDLLGRAKWSADRLTGPLRRPRVGWTLAWIGIPVATYGLHCLMLSENKGWQRLCWLGFVLGVFAIGLLSGDRGGLLEMLLAFSAFCVFWRPLRKRLCWVVLGAALLGGGVLWSDPAALHRQVALTVQKISHFHDSDYGVVYRGGWQTFLDYPVFGVGVRQYRLVCPKNHRFVVETDSEHPISYTIDQAFPCGHHPHNIYLEWLAEAGLVGFMLFMAGLGVALSKGWRSRAILLADPWLLGCAMVLMARLMPVLPSGSMHVVWAACPLWLMLGVLLGALHDDDKIMKG